MEELKQWTGFLVPVATAVGGFIGAFALTRRDASEAREKASNALRENAELRERVSVLEARLEDILHHLEYIREHMLLDPTPSRRHRR